MISYRGWGLLVLPIFFITMWKVQESFPREDASQWSYWIAHWWPLGVVCLVSGAITGCAALLLRNWAPHDMFFIPMHWWAAILGVVGIACLIAEAVVFPATTAHEVLARLSH